MIRSFLHNVLGALALRSSRPSNLFREPTTSPIPPSASNEFNIPPALLLEHGAIFAPSGHGKTQFLQTLIAVLLDNDPPGMFIIDSQGEMLNKIEWLECFNPDDGIYSDRLIIIDPEDPSPPALNLFQLGQQDALIDELFQYIFTAIDNTLSPQQSTTVTYLMRLMHVIPGSTINTLRQVLEEPVKNLTSSAYADYVGKLDPIAQDFFTHQFYQTGTMQVTKSSIARRLYALLANPVFSTIFAAHHNRFDALRAMQEKKIVLINTSQKTLGQGAAVFGRFFIAQALAAAYNRPQHSRDLALLIVDEASEYYDHMTERLLSTARKFGLGMMSASQFLSQMDEKVKAAINGNTAIKIVGPVAYQDANALAREMMTEADFIRSMTKTSTHAEFAFYLRSVTPKAVKVQVPLGKLESLVRMTTAQHAALRRINRERYGTKPHEQPPRPVSTASHRGQVSFPDYGITLPALLDSGASLTAIPVHDIRILDANVRFMLADQEFDLPIIRFASLVGFSGEALQCPVVSLKISVAGHTADEHCALQPAVPNTEILIGRTFLGGRILVSTDHTRPSSDKW